MRTAVPIYTYTPVRKYRRQIFAFLREYAFPRKLVGHHDDALFLPWRAALGLRVCPWAWRKR